MAAFHPIQLISDCIPAPARVENQFVLADVGFQVAAVAHDDEPARGDRGEEAFPVGDARAPLVFDDGDGVVLLTTDADPYDAGFLTGERTAEGFYKVQAGIEQAISRGLAYAPYADMVWCETAKPDLDEARQFAEAIKAQYPDKILAYNCSPSFNWKKNLDDATIARFQQELSDMGYKYQFITLAGIHNMWFHMYELAYQYARGEGMKHYVEMVQQPEFAAAERGYTFVAHQQEVGTGYFDKVTTVIQGGQSSVTALTGSTEEDQFH